MSLSIFLTIYFIFLIIYACLIGFAVYKVFLFAKNKDLKGYSRRITLVFLIVTLSAILFSFLAISRYQWNDGLGFYCKKISPTSCFCITDSVEKKKCELDKQNAEKLKQTTTGTANQIKF